MTPNTLPPGLSEKDFNDALAEFRRIVGDAHVFTGDALVPYRDPYSIEDDAKFSTPAAVAPDSAEQVQAVVKVANQYGVPLWTISAGKNHGYGGAAPRMAGTVVLDLARMNRILEVNVDSGYALLEPGVTYFDLYRYLQERNLKLWLDVPGYGSRDAYTDMTDFTADLTDPRVREDLAASLEGKGAFRRFQDALNRHDVYRVHWRVFSAERRTGRARAWLAEQGYDAVP